MRLKKKKVVIDDILTENSTPQNQMPITTSILSHPQPNLSITHITISRQSTLLNRITHKCVTSLPDNFLNM